MDRLVAIDPLALLLRGDIYVKLTLPDPPPPDVLRDHIRELTKSMGVEQRKILVSRVRTLGALANAFEAELKKGS